jgi:hypothetical protein
MKTDLYTRIVLTVIAICLVYIVLDRADINLVPKAYGQASSNPQRMDVNIAEFGGKPIDFRSDDYSRQVYGLPVYVIAPIPR